MQTERMQTDQLQIEHLQTHLLQTSIVFRYELNADQHIVDILIAVD